MSKLKPSNTLELAQKISQLMDDYFNEHNLEPDEEVLLVTLAARTEAGHRHYLLNQTPG